MVGEVNSFLFLLLLGFGRRRKGRKIDVFFFYKFALRGSEERESNMCINIYEYTNLAAATLYI